MIFPLVATGVFLLPTLLLASLVAIGLLFARRPQRRFWASVLWLHLGLALLHLFVTFPLALGYVGSRLIGTRPQERSYAGPRLGADGELQIQSWDSLAAEQRGEASVDPAVAAAAAARTVLVDSSGGVRVRAFRIEPRREPPRAIAVLVHGLFRSAMEPEPVAAMFRRLGCEVWLLEQRDHGGSGRAPFTAGLRESDDVVAVAAAARAVAGHERLPVVLFGVSLGTAAVALAAPRVPGLAGLVLDAPLADLRAAAHRMLAFERSGDRRSFFHLWEPWQMLTLEAMQWWSDFDVDDVRPAAVLQGMPVDLPVLVIAAGEDDRMPPAIVRQLYDGLPMPEGVKQFWLQPAATHGKVWEVAPAEYERRLAELLQRVGDRAGGGR